MIGQNRQAAFQQAKADSDYNDVDQLLEENSRITRLIQQLTSELHQVVTEPKGADNENWGGGRVHGLCGLLRD
jgi:uncharacterized membrane protein